MSARSLNKVTLIGNLTRDPELRYTPSGTAVCTFSIATNRDWVDQSGQKQESTEFTRVVAWSKLAEICSQLLRKGKKVYIEGRLQTRDWTTKEGQQRQTTEVVINEMIALSTLGDNSGVSSPVSPEEEIFVPDESLVETDGVSTDVDEKKKDSPDKTDKDLQQQDESVPSDDIPF